MRVGHYLVIFQYSFVITYSINFKEETPYREAQMIKKGCRPHRDVNFLTMFTSFRRWHILIHINLVYTISMHLLENHFNITFLNKHKTLKKSLAFPFSENDGLVCLFFLKILIWIIFKPKYLEQIFQENILASARWNVGTVTVDITQLRQLQFKLNQNGAVMIRNVCSYSRLGIKLGWGNAYPSTRPDFQHTSWFIHQNQESLVFSFQVYKVTCSCDHSN